MGCPDSDGDGICNDDDNCPENANPNQEDNDGDGLGDVCDACPNDADNDADGDGVCGDVDICPGGDDNVDGDGDGIPDYCDACPNDADNDADGDGVCGDVDNCPSVANTDQADNDGDGAGDVCDPDDDNDGCLDEDDSNPWVYSGDSDCDGTPDDCDVCPGGDDSVDNDGDGIPDCSQLLDYEDYSADWKCAANKLYICHLDEETGYRHTICVSKNAVAAHLAHGDWAGPCVGCALNIGAPTGNGSFNISDHLEMELVPNPASSLVNVHLHGLADGESTLVVYDQLGKVILSQKMEEDAHQLLLDLPSDKFSAGLYFVRLTSGQATLTQRLVVARK